jgi:hypothetical protein
MDATRITRQIEELKAAAVTRKRRRRAGLPAADHVLARLQAIDRIAADVQAVLDELAATLPGLSVSRRLACGSRVLQITGAARARLPGRRARRTWSRLEFRLGDDERNPGGLRLLCRATVCDADLPGTSTALDLRTGARVAPVVRAFAEEGALAFARALLARRAELAVDASAVETEPEVRVEAWVERDDEDGEPADGLR